MWQDLVLSSIGIVFTISLIPQLIDVMRKKTKMNLTTCIITSVGCIIIGGVDFTLGLPISAIVAISTGVLWGLMLIFSITPKINTENNHVSVYYD
jgi:uncharacterized protein with PQ loop repeat